MKRPLHRRFWAGHNRDRACADSIGDEILAVEAATLECTEYGAARHLAMIDRESGHFRC